MPQLIEAEKSTLKSLVASFNLAAELVIAAVDGNNNDASATLAVPSSGSFLLCWNPDNGNWVVVPVPAGIESGYQVIKVVQEVAG